MPVLSYDFKDQNRDLHEGISLIIKDEPTLLGLVGLNGEPISQTKYEWMSDNLNSNIVVADAAATTSDTSIDLAEGDGDKIRVNAILYINDEYLAVTAVSGDTITVTRGVDDTTPVSIAEGDEIRIVARPQLEGALPGQD